MTNRRFTYNQIANDLELWKTYIDPNAAMTDDEFFALSIDERVTMITDVLGPVSRDNDQELITINQHGTEIDFDAAVKLMDDEICAALHDRLAPCTNQEFFSAYEIEHAKKFGQEWELSKDIPVW